jgi:hypothetical protein
MASEEHPVAPNVPEHGLRVHNAVSHPGRVVAHHDSQTESNTVLAHSSNDQALRPGLVLSSTNEEGP